MFQVVQFPVIHNFINPCKFALKSTYLSYYKTLTDKQYSSVLAGMNMHLFSGVEA